MFREYSIIKKRFWPHEMTKTFLDSQNKILCRIDQMCLINVI